MEQPFLNKLLIQYLWRRFGALCDWEPRSVAAASVYDYLKTGVLLSVFGLLIFMLAYSPVSMLIAMMSQD